MLRLAVVLLVALVALAAWATTGPAQARTPLLGFNDNAAAQELITPEEDARLLARVGAKIHRFTFDWRYAERSEGQLRLDLYDRTYAADLQRGVKPLFILLFSPEWTWAPGTPCTLAVQDCRLPPGVHRLDAWRRIVRTLVTRYPRMAALEVWNEPNLRAFWQPWPDPQYYTVLVAEARNAARAAGSTVPILGGSLANAPAGGFVAGVGARDFLAGMYASGARGSYDGLSVHPYPEGTDLAPALKTLTEIDDLRTEHRDRTPLWVTETGATTTSVGRGLVSDAQQATVIARLRSLLTAREDVRAILFHTLLEPPLGPLNHETGYGILRAPDDPKPAFCALAGLRATACAATLFPAADPLQEARWDAQELLQRAVDASRRHGDDSTLDSRVLHALDGALSPRPARGDQPPGPDADPSRVGVYRFGSGEDRVLVLCVASRADHAYCAQSVGGRWVYGKAAGPVYAAAALTTQGQTFGW